MPRKPAVNSDGCPPQKHAGGRPRDPNWPKEKVIALGEELIEYLLNPEIINIPHLSYFYTKQKKLSRSEWRLIRDRPEFSYYYEMALELVGCRMILDKDIPTAYGSRFMSVYFKDLREHEREIKREEIETSLKVKQEIELSRSVPPNDTANEEKRQYDQRLGELLDEIEQLKCVIKIGQATS